MGRVAQSCGCESESLTVDADAEPCSLRGRGSIGRVAQSGKSGECELAELCCDLLESESKSLVVAAHPSTKAAMVAA